MVKVTTKTEYIAIASESKIVNAWYGDHVIKKGTERKLNKSQAEKAKSAGNAMFPASDEIYAGYYRVPCRVIKRTTRTTVEVVEEEF
jgi:hypothetical protein